ncbi:MAG: PspA/IM30 family protein [Ignavibacteria bacterium]|jgi:phage shock protein A|nr:PspA/IM30 family protein [Ignavibacteria bacterium]
MGIFQRIINLFRSNANAALDNIEDSEKMLKQMVLDMETSINKATTAIAQAIANEKNLARKMEQARKNSTDWQNKAMQALQAGREDLARQALEKKAIEDRNLQDLMPLHTQAAETSKKLREQLSQLKAKLDEAKNRQSTLIARSQAAKAQKQINKNLAGIGTDAFGNFDKYEEKILGLEAEASAYEELAGTNTSLDIEFKKLASNSDIEANLLALKQQMNMLPGSNEQNLLN